jgi:hypothetical protein
VTGDPDILRKVKDDRVWLDARPNGLNRLVPAGSRTPEGPQPQRMTCRLFPAGESARLESEYGVRRGWAEEYAAWGRVADAVAPLMVVAAVVVLVIGRVWQTVQWAGPWGAALFITATTLAVVPVALWRERARERRRGGEGSQEEEEKYLVRYLERTLELRDG